MKINIPGSLFIVLSGFILFLYSCTSESCVEETESYLKAYFYNNAEKKLKAPDSLTVYGLNMESDSTLYVKALNVQPALLPLDASDTSCIFIIQINGITDTVEFSYNNYPHLISKECGYTFYYDLDTHRICTKNKIDSIYISQRKITTFNGENIRIFY